MGSASPSLNPRCPHVEGGNPGPYSTASLKIFNGIGVPGPLLQHAAHGHMAGAL